MPHRDVRRAFAALLAAWALAPIDARAQVDLIELIFGASNLHATTGNGGLTAAVSRDGDLTVLSWPSPSYFDQLHYISANGRGARDQPRMGAHEGMGAFAGLVYSQDGGATRRVTFFRDPQWSRSVRFSSDDTTVIVSTFSRADLGLRVAQNDFVVTDRDVLVRRYTIHRESASPITNAWLLVYSNLSPGLSRVPQIPLTEFLSDSHNDFVAAWDRTRETLVHFHPGDTGVAATLLGAFVSPPVRNFGPLGDLMKGATLDDGALDALLANLDAHYAPGVYAAIATKPAPDQVQVGEDATDTCAAQDDWATNIQTLVATLPPGTLPAEVSQLAGLVRCGNWDPLESVRAAEGWMRAPEDALADAADGALSGSRLAGAQVNTAMRVPLTFVSDVAEVTTYMSFARTASEAHAGLTAARGADVTTLEAAVEAADRAFVATLRLPERVGPELRAFSKRAFLNLRAGMDRTTGAVTSSISRQPSYHLDWPRDGAFFNAALDIAGRPDLTSKRIDFYARVIRTARTPVEVLINTEVPGWPDCPTCKDLPPDSWEMNYFADGLVGGNIRLEIDNTALLVWSFVNHAGYLEAAAERASYLERVWPTVKRASDFLASWRDPATKLVWPANEDDNLAYTQGLQGAGTVFGALRVAAMMAKAMNDPSSAQRYISRADELRRAALDRLYVEGAGFLDQPSAAGVVIPASLNGGGSSWLAWPERFLPYNDPRLVDSLRKKLATQLPKVRGEGEGGAYVTKDAVSAALALPPGPERDLTLELAERMAREIADPDTRFLGEVFLNQPGADGGAPKRVNAVATPHLWAGILLYLVAMAYERPDLFDRYERVLPAVDIPLPAPKQQGCGCGATPDAPGGALFLLAWLFARVARSRRAHRHPPGRNP
jgi:hypothetical protein